MVGGVLSVTVKVAVQVDSLVAPSLTCSVTVVTPNPTNVPAVGDWLKLIALDPLQSSLTVTPLKTSGTGAWQFASELAPGTAEQVTLGAVVSVTVNEAVLVTVPVTPAHWPVTSTWTVWSPKNSPVVGTVRLGPLVPVGLPSTLHR